ncbi:MAG: ABC transporter ATP-binding protein [Candidatus Bathyarchaeia archaeon]|jgi:zinc transport system ATP-binding protein
MKSIVDLKDVWVYYDEKIVLENINLIVKENDFLGIIGPNGGGKTTLLKVILGLIKPNRGDLKVFGGSPENNRTLIGYVPQLRQFDLDFPATVLDVVMTGRLNQTRMFRRYSLEDKKIANKVIEEVNMSHLRHHAIGRLSGGERQRVFMARALASEPKLLLLDEPTANVDKNLDTKLWEFFNNLKKTTPIILVTHDISAVSIYVDKIACLNRRLHYQGTKEITPEALEDTYKCPVELIAHGLPHRVLKEH